MRKLNGNTVIRALRTDLDLTQAEFAVRAGLVKGYVSQLETGHHLLGVEAGLKTWAVFGPDLSRLGFTFKDLLIGGATIAA